MKRTSGYWLRLLGINLALSAVTVLIGLACVEGYLRATIPSSSGGSLFEATLATRRYKVMKPDTRVMAWGREFRTNTLGFRDDKRTMAAKAPAALRIVVLGDSFTASAGVDFDKIYTSVLDRALKQRMPQAEVINLAVGGYNIIQYELVLDEVALGLKPDLVLVSVFPFNDLKNDDYQANYQDAAGLSKPSEPLPWYRELYVYRAFLGRIENRIRRLFVSPAPAAFVQTTGSGPSEPSAAEQNLAALRRTVDKAEAAGVPAIVALLPNTDIYEAQRGDFAPFVELCTAQRWQCLNLLDRFAASGEDPSSLRLNLLDPHPNERYNALVGKFLGEDLLRALAKPNANVPPTSIKRAD